MTPCLSQFNKICPTPSSDVISNYTVYSYDLGCLVPLLMIFFLFLEQDPEVTVSLWLSVAAVLKADISEKQGIRMTALASPYEN